MSRWPKWIRITFLISGSLFVLADLTTVSLVGLRLSVGPQVVPTRDAQSPPPVTPPVSQPEPSGWVLYITALTGLVTAGSGLYGQILAGRKQQLDYELAKQQLQMQAEAKPKKPPRRAKKK